LAPHVPVVQVWAGQSPQLTDCPQLFVTLPHLPPEQVVVWEFGVQQLLPKHTCPLVQQTPLQHVCPPGQAPGVPFVQQTEFATHWLPHGLNPALQAQDVPAPLQVEFAGQAPQEPLQPSGPHVFPEQFGTQTHLPFSHVVLPAHVPQLPPQPSLPQSLPVQLGVQTA
jgi:hypothetical protein